MVLEYLVGWEDGGQIEIPAVGNGLRVHVQDAAIATLDTGVDSLAFDLIKAPAEGGDKGVIPQEALPGSGVGLRLTQGLLGPGEEALVGAVVVAQQVYHPAAAPADVVGGIGILSIGQRISGSIYSWIGSNRCGPRRRPRIAKGRAEILPRGIKQVDIAVGELDVARDSRDAGPGGRGKAED